MIAGALIPRPSWWHVGVLGVSCAAGLVGRGDLLARAREYSVTPNSMDLYLQALLNPYLMVYFIVPISLTVALVRSQPTDATILCRAGSCCPSPTRSSLGELPIWRTAAPSSPLCSNGLFSWSSWSASYS